MVAILHLLAIGQPILKEASVTKMECCMKKSAHWFTESIPQFFKVNHSCTPLVLQIHWWVGLLVGISGMTSHSFVNYGKNHSKQADL